MKYKFYLISLLIPFLILSCEEGDNFLNLKGDYLGQKPPGITPELFAPGIVSTGYNDVSGCISPDGKEYFYSFWENPFSVIVIFKQIEGKWTKPEVASFTKSYPSGEPLITPDGKWLFFMSSMPPPESEFNSQKWYMWFCEKTMDGWSEPQVVEYSKNNMVMYLTSTVNDIVYFTGKGTPGEQDFGSIYRGKFENGNIINAENFGKTVNLNFHGAHPCVAPDESFLIFDSQRLGGFGASDFYISFKDDEGKWTEPVNMGDKINSPQNDLCPYLSPDGKYFFFSSGKADLAKYVNRQMTLEEINEVLKGPQNARGLDIYWVDAKIIEELSPVELLKKGGQ